MSMTASSEDGTLHFADWPLAQEYYYANGLTDGLPTHSTSMPAAPQPTAQPS